MTDFQRDALLSARKVVMGIILIHIIAILNVNTSFSQHVMFFDILSWIMQLIMIFGSNFSSTDRSKILPISCMLGISLAGILPELLLVSLLINIASWVLSLRSYGKQLSE